jgi:dephospho-CoA kinase
MVFPDNVKIFGLTGGICSGKSSAALFWQKNFSLFWISADLAARKLLEPGQMGWQRVKELAGSFILADQQVDRSGLRQALFNDKNLRHDLNQALHPLIKEDIYRQVTDLAAGKEGLQFFLIEVPLLYEVGWDKEFTEVIVVYVDNYQQCRRIIVRDMISETEAERALSCQWPLFDKALWADHVIDNNYCWPLTVLQLIRLGRLLWTKKP